MIKMNKILLILLTLFTISCSQKQVATHMGTGVGAITGYTTCYHLLQTNVQLTAACTVIGAMWGSTMFYQNDMNTHTAIFVDTLNATESLKANLYYGYKVIAAHDNVIYVQIDL